MFLLVEAGSGYLRHHDPPPKMKFHGGNVLTGRRALRSIQYETMDLAIVEAGPLTESSQDLLMIVDKFVRLHSLANVMWGAHRAPELWK